MPCPSGATASPANAITGAIVERLEAGVRPWAKPWTTCPPAVPLRVSGEPYRGINLVWLWHVAEQRGYASRYWMTFRQAQRLGGRVRRGERSTVAVFYLPIKPHDAKTDDEAITGTRHLLRSYSIFNADQVDGIDGLLDDTSPVLPPIAERRPVLDAFFAALPGRVQLGGERACYDPVVDCIRLPEPARFVTIERFYATLAHERAHWTGHRSRLARDFGQRFGDAAYALEELTAELASAMLGAELGLPVEHLDDHAAYIGAWIRVLKAHPRALLTVAGKAQAAADYLRVHGAPTPSGRRSTS